MRLLIVVNADWFLLSHRLPVALGALHAGYEVHVAAPLTRDKYELERYGFIVHPIDFERSGINPFGLLRLFFDYLFLFWKLNPDVVHLVTIKPVIVGGLAARLSRVRGVVYAVSGLGHVFLAQDLLAILRLNVVRILYKVAMGVKNKRVIFQNPSDRQEIQNIAKLRDGQIVMIPGSGVNLSVYNLHPLPYGVPVILMASRLLSTKGVREFISAAQVIRNEGITVRFWLVGDLDPSNPASVLTEELSEWNKNGYVELLGHCSDIPSLMSKSYAVVLPSYREGLPKVLIEAAACGRAVVTTNVPGCRDAIEAGVTGLLVPSKDAVALANAIKYLVINRNICEAMGRAGRERAERIFDDQEVVKTHLDIYQNLGTLSKF